MKIRINIAVMVAGALLLSACGSEQLVEQYSVEKRFSIGMKKFKDEEYLDAIEDFKVVTLQFQGSKLADDAQFYMGECRYLRGEYVLAAYEYDLLIRTMPTSEFVPKARFRKAMCYYNLSPESYRDQDYTRKAVDEFQAFIEYNPTDSLVTTAESKILELNTKLAKKDYESGMIYMKMEYYKSATVYFDLVLEKYHDTPFAEPALLKKVEALYYRKRYSEAKQEIDRFLTKYPASVLRQDAEKLRNDIQSKMAEPTQKTLLQTPSAENNTKSNG